MTNDFTKRIALDFDGVLHSYVSGYTGNTPTDPPTDGALAFVEWLISEGYEPFVLTSRALDHAGQQEVERWLKKYNFPPMLVTALKFPATLYIDDRAIRFQGYFRTIKRIMNAPDIVVPWCGSTDMPPDATVEIDWDTPEANAERIQAYRIGHLFLELKKAITDK